jgi:hypothetical protein
LLEVEERSERLHQDPHGVRALSLLGMGREEEAFAELQGLCKEHPQDLLALRVDPFIDPLRDDPRFGELVRCIHQDAGS